MQLFKTGSRFVSVFFFISIFSQVTIADDTRSEITGSNANAPALADQPISGLSAALRATMNHNPAIKGKQAEVNAQKFNIESAKAKRYPTLTAQANNVNDNFDQGTLRVDQPLWAFGKIDAAIDQAEAGFSTEQWGLLQVQRQLIEDTATTYAKIEGIRQREQVSQMNIAEHERLHERISRRNKGQLASEADVRLAYSRLLQARAQMQRIRGELLVAHNELQALTQTSVATQEPVDSRLVEIPIETDIERLALEKSADVRFKRRRLEVIRLDVKREKLSSTPTVYFRVEHDAFDHAANIDETRTGLAIESSFEGLGFVALGRVKGAESRLEAANYDLDTALNEVKRKVNSLMLNRRVQKELEESQTLTTDAVKATMASFLRQYKSGRKSWVEVLNTQRELTETRLLLAQIKNEWLNLSLRIAAITGGLDQQAGISLHEQ